MNCDELRAAAHDYFGGHLAPSTRARYEAHVATCAACAEFMVVCREITCRELTEFLDDYLEGELAPDRRAVFERHLAICPDCSNYLQSYGRTRRLGRVVLAPDALAEMPEALVQAILAARRRT